MEIIMPSFQQPAGFRERVVVAPIIPVAAIGMAVKPIC
jgi:hypothetical protein